MAIRTVVTRGYGNGTFSGTIALVVTRGYAIGEAATLATYTTSLFCNPSPVVSLFSNPSPVVNLKSNPSPAKELKSG